MERGRLRRLVRVIAGSLVLALGLGTGSAEQLLQVEVDRDGQVYQVVTRARTVGELLAELELPVGEEDVVHPPATEALRAGLRVVIQRAVSVTLTVDGRTLTVRTTGRTPREVLKAAGVQLGPLDRVEPPLDAPLRSGDRVRVIRVREERVVVRETIPFPVEHRFAWAHFARGTEVIQPGRSGVVEHVYRVVRVDGQVVRRERVARRVVRSPQPRIVRVGRGYVPSRGELARRPSLVMVATAYAPYADRGVDEVTATGMRARYGVVAVDPRVIPLRTVLYVEGYGTAIAADTGSAIRGLRIDLCFNSAREALRWGRRRVRVWILGR